MIASLRKIFWRHGAELVGFCPIAVLKGDGEHLFGTYCGEEEVRMSEEPSDLKSCGSEAISIPKDSFGFSASLVEGGVVFVEVTSEPFPRNITRRGEVNAVFEVWGSRVTVLIDEIHKEELTSAVARIADMLKELKEVFGVPKEVHIDGWIAKQVLIYDIDIVR